MRSLNIAIFIVTTLVLSSCGGIKNKASTNSHSSMKAPTNIAGIPAQCKDKSGKYKPVQKILSKGSYNSKPADYKPINNYKGFIVADFNRDKYFDLAFIERSGARIRLVTCISHRAKMQRRVTPFIVHETIEPDFQTISESIQYKNQKLILSVNKHEHNWGSDSEIKAYMYNNKVGGFMLEKLERHSSSGDGMRSDTDEFYNLINNRYKKSSICGGSEEGCKSRKVQKETGRLIAAKPRSTLLQPTKIYHRLISD